MKGYTLIEVIMLCAIIGMIAIIIIDQCDVNIIQPEPQFRAEDTWKQ
tara:strand:+ start:473 stop:613 length:141 start_codon:yes stop_codon:yes gene_type:complete